jgi:predicted amidophosphoribosyltransferase
MPRLIGQARCPHCGAERPDRESGSCDECGGSLQQRHLKAGCVSVAPLWIALASLAWIWVQG